MVLTGPTTANRPSEGGHFYQRDGAPCYEVARADGKGMRPATLRDARKRGLYPGVTSIIKCAAAPGLERWKRDQVLMAALTLPRIEGESNDALVARILKDSEEQGRKARDRGTEIHAAIQGHYEGKPPSEEMWPYVKGVIAAIDANFPGCQWFAERPCAHPLGFGTKADLSSANVVIDFKGSEFTAAEAPTLKTWDEHAMQLAATRNALKLPNADCAICYVSRTEPGICRIIRIDEQELMRGWNMFCSLVTFWQARANYHPALWTEKEAA